MYRSAVVGWSGGSRCVTTLWYADFMGGRAYGGRVWKWTVQFDGYAVISRRNSDVFADTRLEGDDVLYLGLRLIQGLMCGDFKVLLQFPVLNVGVAELSGLHFWVGNGVYVR